MTDRLTVYEDQELPPISVEWLEQDGTPVDFSTGWTWELELIGLDGYRALLKTGGITGANTLPNLQVAFSDGELAGLAGVYRMRLVATNTTSELRRTFSPEDLPILTVRAAPTDPPATP